jgi:isoquinoline 1-oxidoreductase subunit alpha
MPELMINGQSCYSDALPDTPLSWVIREDLRLAGTKYGCGVGLCGSCTVQRPGAPLLRGRARQGARRSAITTIEGLHPANAHAVQRAWIEHQVPQCGYCQSGQIMQAVAFLARNPDPTNEQIASAVDGNLCRCATYARIVAAVKRAGEILREGVNNG